MTKYSIAIDPTDIGDRQHVTIAQGFCALGFLKSVHVEFGRVTTAKLVIETSETWGNVQPYGKKWLDGLIEGRIEPY